jgi:hypothetical protein
VTGFLTAKQLAEKFPLANLSALPTSNPGGGKPWLSGGAVVVGNYAGNTVDWSAIANKPTEFNPTAHNHDDRYYTKSEIDAGYARLSGGNTFSGNQVVTGNVTASGTVSATTGLDVGGVSAAIRVYAVVDSNAPRVGGVTGGVARWEVGGSSSNSYLVNYTGGNVLLRGSNVQARNASNTDFSDFACRNITTVFLTNTPNQSSVAGTLLGSTGNGPWVRGAGASYTISRSDSQVSASLYFYNIGGETVQAVGRLGIGGIVQGPQSFLSAASDTLSLWQSNGTTLGTLNLASLSASGPVNANGGIISSSASGIYVGRQGLAYNLFVTSNAASGRVGLPQNSVFGWASNADPGNALTAGFSQTAANTVALGNGTFGNASGTLNLASLNASSQVIIDTVASMQHGLTIRTTGSGMALRVQDPTGTQNFLTITSNGQIALPALGRFDFAHGSQVGDPNMIITGGGAGLGVKSDGGFFVATGGTGRRFSIDTAGAVTCTSFIASGFRSLSANPTTLDIAAGQEQLVLNTTSNELRRWANVSGTMRSVLYA